MNLKYTSFS